MSGIEAVEDSSLDALEALLRRDEPLDTFTELASALEPKSDDKIPVVNCALCLDSNVFLKLAGHPERENILDYFSAKHKSPLIISAQSVQEFWNSQLHGVETIATSIDKKLGDLEKEVNKVESEFGDYKRRFAELIQEFQAEYGHLHDKNARRNVGSLVEMLSKKATVVEVPRHRYQGYAIYRQRTKTPPGFKDSGDGDFFVWIDFLHGMKVSQLAGLSFKKSVMVTNDKKNDWSRGGVPHPTLSAEVSKLIEVPFEIWDIERLATAIKAV